MAGLGVYGSDVEENLEENRVDIETSGSNRNPVTQMRAKASSL
jgi:hypothetical protein